jgi:hypothetical protein
MKTIKNSKQSTRRKRDWFMIIGSIYVFCIIVYVVSSDWAMSKNLGMTDAVIIELFDKPKFKKGLQSGVIHYVYSVDGVNYRGKGDRLDYWDRTGDTIVIVYNKKRPSYSHPCRQTRHYSTCGVDKVGIFD